MMTTTPKCMKLLLIWSFLFFWMLVKRWYSVDMPAMNVSGSPRLASMLPVGYSMMTPIIPSMTVPNTVAEYFLISSTSYRLHPIRLTRNSRTNGYVHLLKKAASMLTSPPVMPLFMMGNTMPQRLMTAIITMDMKLRDMAIS